MSIQIEAAGIRVGDNVNVAGGWRKVTYLHVPPSNPDGVELRFGRHIWTGAVDDKLEVERVGSSS